MVDSSPVCGVCTKRRVSLPLKSDLARTMVRLLRRLDIAECAAYGSPQDGVERSEAERVLLRYQHGEGVESYDYRTTADRCRA
jgi:hypothetical protein